MSESKSRTGSYLLIPILCTGVFVSCVSPNIVRTSQDGPDKNFDIVNSDTGTTYSNVNSGNDKAPAGNAVKRPKTSFSPVVPKRNTSGTSVSTIKAAGNDNTVASVPATENNIIPNTNQVPDPTKDVQGVSAFNSVTVQPDNLLTNNSTNNNTALDANINTNNLSANSTAPTPFPISAVPAIVNSPTPLPAPAFTPIPAIPTTVPATPLPLRTPSPIPFTTPSPISTPTPIPFPTPLPFIAPTPLPFPTPLFTPRPGTTPSPAPSATSSPR